MTREPLEIANTLNYYFSTIFTNDDGNNPGISTKTTSTEISNIQFTPHIVCLTLLGLKSSLSAGPDGIPNSFLKKCASSPATPLSHLFEVSFKDQKLPQDWKIALVTPIHKKGPTTSPENYRPISITSTCCRVMERIITKFLLQNLLHYNLIGCSQHAFFQLPQPLLTSSNAPNSGLMPYRTSKILTQFILDFRKVFNSVSYVNPWMPKGGTIVPQSFLF